jgi:endonuclease III
MRRTPAAQEAHDDLKTKALLVH